MTSYDVGAFAKYGPNFKHSPQDTLRPTFSRNVVGPLAHAVFAGTVDACLERFYDTLHGEEGAHIRNVATVDESQGPRPMLLAMSLDKSLQFFAERYLVDVAGVLTDEQRIALHRYFVGGSARDPNKPLMGEASTVMSATGNITFRHPELQFNEDVEKLVAFWRDERTPRLLRGFAAGGSGFADGLRGINGHLTQTMWQDPHAAVLDTTGSQLKVHPAVTAAAKTHIAYNAALNSIYPEGGITRMAVRYSAGCPARFLGFSTVVPELTKQGLALTNKQVSQLNELGNDVFSVGPRSPDQFMVRRDSYAGMCGVLATGVSIVAGLEQ